MYYEITYGVRGGEMTTIRVDGTANHAEITGLRANTTYRVVIQAFDANGREILVRANGNLNPLVINATTARGTTPTERSANAAPNNIQRFAGLNSVTLDFNRTTNHSIVKGGDNATWVRVEIIRTSGAANLRGHIDTRVLQVDNNGRVVLDDLIGNRTGYQFRVSIVTMDNDGVITNTTQARNVSQFTLRLNTNNQFPAVTGLRIAQGTTPTAAQIQLTWWASNVSEVGFSTVPGESYRISTVVGGVTTELTSGVTITYEPADSRGRILVRATIEDHGLVGTGNRIAVVAVASDTVAVESRIARTGLFRIR
jgi:hypothetical protein